MSKAGFMRIDVFVNPFLQEEANMKDFNERVEEAVRCFLKNGRGGGKKLAIYPFGDVGMRTKALLNWKYGVEEALIVDNKLALVNPEIASLEQVKNPEAYIWLLTCGNLDYHKEILRSVQQLVPENQILDLFAHLPVYSEKYHLLSKLGSPEGETVSWPCREFLELVSRKKNERKTITVAEIGVGWGATSVEVCRRLHKEDVYMCFDFEDVVEGLLHDLGMVPGICCQVTGKGNSHRACDSYSWSLSELLFEMRNRNQDGIFDIAFLDGSHTFLHDASACCLLKELVKPDGYLIFDDVFWSCAEANRELYQEWEDLYTKEQLHDYQVQRVIDAFMTGDRRFQQVYMTQSLNPSRAVYRKTDL